MIIGIGSDLCDVRRIEKTLARFGQRFVDRVFTDVEQRKSDRRAERAASYAKRFAAKEAIVKALGTGFAHGIWIRDVGIAPNAWGRPEVIWSERGRALRDRLGAGEGHVTLTDEAGLVVAVAVLMKRVEQVQ